MCNQCVFKVGGEKRIFYQNFVYFHRSPVCLISLHLVMRKILRSPNVVKHVKQASKGHFWSSNARCLQIWNAFIFTCHLSRLHFFISDVEQFDQSSSAVNFSAHCPSCSQCRLSGTTYQRGVWSRKWPARAQGSCRDFTTTREKADANSLFTEAAMAMEIDFWRPGNVVTCAAAANQSTPTHRPNQACVS